MTVKIFTSDSRGESNLGWLHSRFSFSFANYHNPDRMGFGKLRVINDDIVQGGGGFGMHPHSNMEIISIITKGQLLHKDSMGNDTIVKAGDVQVMSAGSGVMHSEANGSDTEDVTFFQIWIEPKEQNLEPRHDEKTVEIGKNELKTIVSSFTEQSGQLHIHQDATIKIGEFDQESVISYNLKEGFGIHIIVVEGSAELDGKTLNRRDAAESTENVTITAKKGSKLMTLEVPLE